MCPMTEQPHPGHCTPECPSRYPDCEDNCFQHKFSVWLAVNYPKLATTYHLDICEHAADIAADVYNPQIPDTRSRPAPAADAPKQPVTGCWYYDHNVCGLPHPSPTAEHHDAAIRKATIYELLKDLGYGCPGGEPTPICELCKANQYCIELRREGAP